MKANFKSANASAYVAAPWNGQSQSSSQGPISPLRSFGSPASPILDSAASALAEGSIAPQLQFDQGWNTKRGLSRRFLRLAIAYMEEHIGEKFTLEELAREVGISRFHFSRLFRMSTGTSPMVYGLHLRIERSKSMLLRGDRKCCDIATTLGFFDQSHFSRTFRRMTGVSPGEYVRMCDATGIAM